MSNTNIIEIENATKTYPLGKTTVHALRGVSFKIESGAFMSIIGPSGSGKTTLLNLIGCVDKPSSGIVRIDGENTADMTDNMLTDLRLYKIGFIFQSFNLIPVLNVLENVEFPLLLMRKFSREEVRQRAMDIIEKVQILDQVAHRPSELSGGQRQRVAIARALVTHPRLVLADEPTANLDSETGTKILELMQSLNQSLGMTFLFSTHDSDVLRYALESIKLRDGSIC